MWPQGLDRPPDTAGTLATIGGGLLTFLVIIVLCPLALLLFAPYLVDVLTVLAV